MYVHLEHYIDDADFEQWLNGMDLCVDDAYHDYSLIQEFLENHGDSGQVVNIL